jgi:hypothetical protein
MKRSKILDITVIFTLKIHVVWKICCPVLGGHYTVSANIAFVNDYLSAPRRIATMRTAGTSSY